ncbi:hypothetical protein [Azospirillum sp. ST 5-10]|uniref:hypothetical protein n=1 Tax=unclassified Azospirillum TaxID=2630922 RepID=UPI003F4A63C1
MPIDPAGTSALGAALTLQQGLGRMAFGVSALAQTAQQQQEVVTSLLGGTGSTGSGNATATGTRGQALDILV